MLRVTIELLPHGDETRKRVLGVCEIANDGTGTPVWGNYNVLFKTAGALSRAWRVTRVEGFPRRRLLAWDLLYRALRNVVGDRNA